MIFYFNSEKIFVRLLKNYYLTLRNYIASHNLVTTDMHFFVNYVLKT